MHPSFRRGKLSELWHLNLIFKLNDLVVLIVGFVNALRCQLAAVSNASHLAFQLQSNDFVRNASLFLERSDSHRSPC